MPLCSGGARSRNRLITLLPKRALWHSRAVRINAVAPSIAMHEFLAKVTTPAVLQELSAREAFGRPAEAWEVANVIVFLASDLSSYMTGEIVPVSSQRA
jgi:3-oxoacyl-[acyl-carrier protein] reductase